MEKLKKLIEEYEKLDTSDKDNQDETFISIIRGKENDEKVSSNILAFFLDTSREHNLGDLFAKSLLECIGLTPEQYSNEYSVETEYHTDKGNFIDILVFNEDVNIIIENKIYANLYNDLKDYYETIDSKFKKETIGIVLSINRITSNDIVKYVSDKIEKGIFNNEEEANTFLSAKYKFITYGELLGKIKMNLGCYIQNISQKYFPLFLDYMDNIENLISNKKMDSKIVEFIQNNEQSIISLETELLRLRKEMRDKVKRICGMLKGSINNQNSKIWAYRELPELFDDVVVDYYHKNDKRLNVAFDSYIKLQGWEFHIWIRESSPVISIELPDFVQQELGMKCFELDSKEFKGRYQLEFDNFFSYDTNENEIANFIANVINKLELWVEKTSIY